MNQTLGHRKIIIAGGGFGGIRTALDLAEKNLPNTKIILVSDKPHFEYHAALYRVATGRSPLGACVPLRDIFRDKYVEVLKDTVVKVDIKEKTLEGNSGSLYSFDFLVLALGSETVYFNIPGLKELSFGFKSINEALILKRHLHKLFIACEKATAEEKVCSTHIVVVGGGSSGTELAGELAVYTRKLARKHHLEPSLVTIDLIESVSRLLPALPKDVSERVKRRLHRLGVNVFLNRVVIREEIEEIYLKDMEMKTKTVIWTAGVKPNHLYTQIDGLTFDKKGRVVVDEFLQPKGFSNIFVIGDAAATPHTGLAQTAIRDGSFVANTIIKKIYDRPLESYIPKSPSYAIPVGPGWAAVLIGGCRFYGRLGWWLRRLADLKFFLSFLPFRKALSVYQSGKTLCESCAICYPEND